VVTTMAKMTVGGSSCGCATPTEPISLDIVAPIAPLKSAPMAVGMVSR